ncbi:MBL fold metallo-hydrolase [Halobacteriales archaeon QH_3_68_24]|nr:MAG: MBL fold metallo-hydrolase [Halobacteriales archaeon QH_3_68_24]
MVRRLGEGLWLLNLGLAPPFASNGYLVDDGDLTLVDPGLPYNRPRLRSQLTEAGYELTDLDRVLVTHFDLEHSGGLGLLAPEFDGPAYIGQADLAIANGGSLPNPTHHKGIYHRLVRSLVGLPEDVRVEPVTDGDEIGGFVACHTPGHNPGHFVYYHEGQSAAFLGDLVWEENGKLTPPFWLDSYDMRGVRESIRDLTERVPPFEVAAVAHGQPLLEDGRKALLDCSARL